MKWILGAGAALMVLPASAGAARRPLLHDPVSLNIGVNCQWQQRCMAKQRAAMERALSYVDKYKPPRWRVQLCNRNAGRGGYRVMIEGSPRMECVLEMADEHGDHAVGGVVLTAARIVNAIPAVCAARPGPLSALDLPLITGRGLGPK